MLTPRKTIAVEPVRQQVSAAGPRNAALVAPVAIATRRGPTVPVTARVRDNLVLRVVVKKPHVLTPPRRASDDRESR